MAKEMSRRKFLKLSSVALGATTMAREISSSLSKDGLVAEASESTPIYEIYALKYVGPVPAKLAFVLLQTGYDRDIELNNYFWVIRGKEEFIIVDTGGNPTWVEKLKLKGYVNPLNLLARLGVDSMNVKKVIISHFHWDHVGGIETFPKAFPNATFYVQEEEFDFWLKDPMAKRYPFARRIDEIAFKNIAALENSGRLVLVRGDQEILPGIELLFAPGHTVGLQTVAVNTVKGTAIVASDCVHIVRNIKEDNPSSLVTDLVAWMKSYDKLRAKASSIDLIFPGHDSSMFQNYPKFAEGVTRLV